MNIYVGNLPFAATEEEVSEIFAAYGQVSSVALIKDRETGKMRGFGFVEMPNQEEAQAAIQALNGKEYMRRNLVVNEARPREERPGGGGGGRRRPGGGGFDRGGGGGGGNRYGRDDRDRRY